MKSAKFQVKYHCDESLAVAFLYASTIASRLGHKTMASKKAATTRIFAKVFA